MQRLIASSLVSCAALACAGSARADIYQYGLFRAQRFVQTTATPSSSPVSFDCELRADASDATTMTGGTVTWVGPDSPATMTFFTQGYGTNDVPLWEYMWASASFATQGDLDTNCPTVSYAFAFVNGVTSIGQATFIATPSNYTTSVPGVDPTSFGAVQAFVPSQTVTLSTLAHAQSPNTQFTGTWLDVDDAVTNTTVASGFTSASGALAVQIDGGTLAPAHPYVVQVFFSDRVIVDDAGFGSTSTESAFDRTTQLPFETLLEDGGAPPVDGGGVDATTEGDSGGPVEDAALPAADSGSGSSSGGGSGSSSGGPTTNPSAPIDSGLPSSGAQPPSNGGGGGICSFVAGPHRGSGPLFVAIGAVAFAALRRRRRVHSRRLA